MGRLKWRLGSRRISFWCHLYQIAPRNPNYLLMASHPASPNASNEASSSHQIIRTRMLPKPKNSTPGPIRR